MGVFIILVWIVIAAFCSQIASNKGRSSAGWAILGLIFGPLALLFIALAGADTRALDHQAVRYGEKRRCPACAEVIQLQAVLCPHCRSTVPAAEPDALPRFSLTVYLIGFFVVIYLLGQLASCVSGTYQ